MWNCNTEFLRAITDDRNRVLSWLKHVSWMSLLSRCMGYCKHGTANPIITILLRAVPKYMLYSVNRSFTQRFCTSLILPQSQNIYPTFHPLSSNNSYTRSLRTVSLNQSKRSFVNKKRTQIERPLANIYNKSFTVGYTNLKVEHSAFENTQIAYFVWQPAITVSTLFYASANVYPAIKSPPPRRSKYWLEQCIQFTKVDHFVAMKKCLCNSVLKCSL